MLCSVSSPMLSTFGVEDTVSPQTREPQLDTDVARGSTSQTCALFPRSAPAPHHAVLSWRSAMSPGDRENVPGGWTSCGPEALSCFLSEHAVGGSGRQSRVWSCRMCLACDVGELGYSLPVAFAATSSPCRASQAHLPSYWVAFASWSRPFPMTRHRLID